MKTACERCDGSGRSPTDDCDECNGWGYLYNPMGKEDCDACKGTGKGVCGDCGGSGLEEGYNEQDE